MAPPDTSGKSGEDVTHEASLCLCFVRQLRFGAAPPPPPLPYPTHPQGEREGGRRVICNAAAKAWRWESGYGASDGWTERTG